MLVEVEAGLSMADEPGSLMDRALVGLITMSRTYALDRSTPYFLHIRR